MVYRNGWGVLGNSNGISQYNNKMSKRRSSVEEQLLIMIYKLIEKKTSEIFRQPVDPAVLPDYYEKIKKPIDISTIIKRLRDNYYHSAWLVKDDFKLMMTNCKTYNVRADILRTADKFQKSIETEWGNFEKECKREGLNISEPLTITEEVLKIFDAIEEKYNRKPHNLQNILGQLEPARRNVAEYKILPPIPLQLLQSDKPTDELPPQLNFKPIKYSNMKSSEKSRMFRFNLQRERLSGLFEEMAQKKLAKYKKILNNKIKWIENKIFRKCLERKRFRKMSTVQYLVQYSDGDKLSAGLQLRNIQMYVKMVAYWIEEYPDILGPFMKNKLIDTCRTIKRAIFRVLRYRRLPRSTKIQLDLNEEANPTHPLPSAEPLPPDEFTEDESRRYDNEIKNFKRMLAKDQSETIKKYTKIMIKWENGEWVVSDFSAESLDKKKTNRVSVATRNHENTEENLKIERQKRRNEEKLEDQQFLATFANLNSVELINNFKHKLDFDWDQLFLSRIPPVLEFKPQELIFT